MDPDSPDHSHPFSNNTRATPARLHILHQSRGAHSRGILDDQHLVECCGLSHISWKYLVGAELAGVRGHNVASEGLAGERDDIQSTNEAVDETGDLWMRCRRENLSTGLARLSTRSEIL